MSYLFAHGSTATPDNLEDFKLQMFDYQVDQNDRTKNTQKAINNGLDSHGPGIYSFYSTPEAGEGFPQELIKNAEGYANNDNGDGTVVCFSLKEDTTPANEYPADMITEHEWEGVVESMIKCRREANGVDHDEASELLSTLVSDWSDSGEHPSNQELEKLAALSGVPFDEFPDLDDPYDFESELLGAMELNDPASKIFDEGGPAGVVQYALDRSDNLWDVCKELYFLTAVEHTGKGILSFNKSFENAVKANVEDMSLLRFALVDEGRFAVVFDTEQIVPEVMVTSKVSLNNPKDEEKIQDFLNGVYWLHENHPELSVEHIKSTVATHAKTFGVELSDDTLSRLAITRDERAMYPSLNREVRRAFGENQVLEYDSGSPASQQFLGLYDPPEEKVEPMRLSR